MVIVPVSGDILQNFRSVLFPARFHQGGEHATAFGGNEMRQKPYAGIPLLILKTQILTHHALSLFAAGQALHLRFFLSSAIEKSTVRAMTSKHPDAMRDQYASMASEVEPRVKS